MTTATTESQQQYLAELIQYLGKQFISGPIQQRQVRVVEHCEGSDGGSSSCANLRRTLGLRALQAAFEPRLRDFKTVDA